jgi:hypothetical protein
MPQIITYRRRSGSANPWITDMRVERSWNDARFWYVQKRLGINPKDSLYA